jgi:malate dehydrogenase (oxaloacetate-decarboxylating)(NADP+)
MEKNVLFQFHGFKSNTAFRLSEIYLNTATSFNDDIQGTASVVLAGILASNQITGKNKLSEHRFMFTGSDRYIYGITDLLIVAMMQETPEMTLKEAKEKIFFVDSKGLVSSQQPFSVDRKKWSFMHDLKGLLNYTGPG